MAQVGNFLTTKAHFKGKPKTPKPIPRPGDKPAGTTIRSRRTYTLDQLAEVREQWVNQEAVETTREVN